MMCLLLHYHILQQSGILARCIVFCFVAFHRIYMYVCVFFATTSLVNKDYYNIKRLNLAEAESSGIRYGTAEVPVALVIKLSPARITFPCTCITHSCCCQPCHVQETTENAFLTQHFPPASF